MSRMFKIAWLGYVLIGTSTAGYFGYYLPNEDAFIWHWVILGFLGLISLVYKNSKLTKDKKLKTIGLDVLYILALPLIASIPLPRGLSIVLLAVVAGILGMLFIKYALNPWNNKREHTY